MSRFKDAIERDVRNVFIDEDYFAERHRLGPDGVEVPCIIDKEIIAGGTFGNREGVFSNTLTIYVPDSCLPEVPVEGQPFSVDGSFHVVRSVSAEVGVLVIVCEVNEE
jgi:hypothetical protein